MWPVDIHGRSCDLKGQPLPTQEDGRPEWPVDMQGIDEHVKVFDFIVVNIGRL